MQDYRFQYMGELIILFIGYHLSNKSQYIKSYLQFSIWFNHKNEMSPALFKVLLQNKLLFDSLFTNPVDDLKNIIQKLLFCLISYSVNRTSSLIKRAGYKRGDQTLLFASFTVKTFQHHGYAEQH
jgi:hypothetical protein